jgi:hypothetical protein
MNKNKLSILVGFAAAVSATATRADLIVTYAEDPGAVNSTVPDTQVLNWSGDSAFSSVGQYNNVNWSGVGTIDQVYLQAANQYGSATGAGYYPVQSNPIYGGSVGGANAVETSTLKLASPSAYFGLWWSAGDNYNTLSFYSGTKLEGSFTTSSLLDLLPSSYYGNPTAAFKGQDGGEPFAFINFYGTGGLTWTSVQLTDSYNTGFESDNWTSRVGPWGSDPKDVGPLPGVPVVDVVPTPEPANLVAGLAVSIVFAAGAWRARSRRLSTVKI